VTRERRGKGKDQKKIVKQGKLGEVVYWKLGGGGEENKKMVYSSRIQAAAFNVTTLLLEFLRADYY
jgi:hypothetical protein